ncbi:MAG: dockerin type I domain-containing protein [bacterium]|nr:dockerin type I domain-containing protein [bacterium]
MRKTYLSSTTFCRKVVLDLFVFAIVFLAGVVFVGVGKVDAAGNIGGGERMVPLRQNEYIIPDAVMDSYAWAIDERIRNNPGLYTMPGGTAIDVNRLVDDAYRRFQEDMKKHNFTTKEIRRFVLVLSEPGNIIVTESVATKNPEESPIINLPGVLAHERTHRFINTLNEHEIAILKEAWEGLLKQTVKEDVPGMGETDTPLIKDRIFIVNGTDIASAFSTIPIASNWTELYAYLAQGVLDERVEKTLQAQYPEAYEIFQRGLKTMDVINSGSFHEGSRYSPGLELQIVSPASSVAFPCPEDVNKDGQINIVDLVTIARKFGQQVGAGAKEDVSGDGVVNIIDLVTVARDFGKGQCIAARVLQSELAGVSQFASVLKSIFWVIGE